MRRNALKSPQRQLGDCSDPAFVPSEVHVAEIAFDCVRIALFRWLDLNHPPTAVGGIFEIRKAPFVDWI